jgi:hypothetical protein
MTAAESLWAYAFLALIVVVLPLGLAVCGALTGASRSRAPRFAGLILLAAGVVVLMRQVLRTGLDDLIAGVHVAGAGGRGGDLLPRGDRSGPVAARRGRRPHVAAAGWLLAAAAVIQSVGPWMLVSGE